MILSGKLAIASHSETDALVFSPAGRKANMASSGDSNVPAPSLQEIHDFLIELAFKAGDIILGAIPQVNGVDSKKNSELHFTCVWYSTVMSATGTENCQAQIW
jgi:hypothetical protein